MKRGKKRPHSGQKVATAARYTPHIRHPPPPTHTTPLPLPPLQVSAAASAPHPRIRRGAGSEKSELSSTGRSAATDVNEYRRARRASNSKPRPAALGASSGKAKAKGGKAAIAPVELAERQQRVRKMMTLYTTPEGSADAEAPHHHAFSAPPGGDGGQPSCPHCGTPDTKYCSGTGRAHERDGGDATPVAAAAGSPRSSHSPHSPGRRLSPRAVPERLPPAQQQQHQQQQQRNLPMSLVEIASSSMSPSLNSSAITRLMRARDPAPDAPPTAAPAPHATQPQATAGAAAVPAFGAMMSHYTYRPREPPTAAAAAGEVLHRGLAEDTPAPAPSYVAAATGGAAAVPREGERRPLQERAAARPLTRSLVSGRTGATHGNVLSPCGSETLSPTAPKHRPAQRDHVDDDEVLLRLSQTLSRMSSPHAAAASASVAQRQQQQRVLSPMSSAMPGDADVAELLHWTSALNETAWKPATPHIFSSRPTSIV